MDWDTLPVSQRRTTFEIVLAKVYQDALKLSESQATRAARDVVYLFDSDKGRSDVYVLKACKMLGIRSSKRELKSFLWG